MAWLANAVNKEKHQTRSRRKRSKSGGESPLFVHWLHSIGSNSVAKEEYCFETVEVDGTSSSVPAP